MRWTYASHLQVSVPTGVRVSLICTYVMAEAEVVDEELIWCSRSQKSLFKLHWVAVSHDDPSPTSTSSMTECQFLRYLEAVAARMVDRIKLPTRRTSQVMRRTQLSGEVSKKLRAAHRRCGIMRDEAIRLNTAEDYHWLIDRPLSGTWSKCDDHNVHTKGFLADNPQRRPHEITSSYSNTVALSFIVMHAAPTYSSY